MQENFKDLQETISGIHENEICRRIVQSCEGCQRGTDYRPRRQTLGHVTAPNPWDTLCVDIVGPLPPGQERERFILTVVDCFSKYVILIPLKDHKASTVSRMLYERVIAYFGVPNRILSDRGAEFTGQIWKNLLEIFGVQRILTSPYHPQGNSVAERMHRTVGNMLRAHIVSKPHEKWNSLLPGVMLALNEMPQGEHSYSAAQILTGRNIQLPVDLIWPQQRRPHDTVPEYIKEVKKTFKDVHPKVMPRCTQHPTGINPFNKGDLILVLAQYADREHKLSPHWKGPFRVCRIPNRYQVEYKEGGKSKLSNILYCKRFQPTKIVYNSTLSPQHPSGRYKREDLRELSGVRSSVGEAECEAVEKFKSFADPILRVINRWSDRCDVMSSRCDALSDLSFHWSRSRTCSEARMHKRGLSGDREQSWQRESRTEGCGAHNERGERGTPRYVALDEGRHFRREGPAPETPDRRERKTKPGVASRCRVK